MSVKCRASLVGRPRRRALLVDTNVFLLLLVGSVDPALIRTFKRTVNRGFTEADFELLREFIAKFQKLVTTPHILTEVSNYADNLKGDYHLRTFRGLIALIERLEEHAEASKTLASTEAFVKLGLTDAAIGLLAQRGITVLTEDFELAGYLEKQRVDVVNFNHLRQLDWESGPG